MASHPFRGHRDMDNEINVQVEEPQNNLPGELTL